MSFNQICVVLLASLTVNVWLSYFLVKQGDKHEQDMADLTEFSKGKLRELRDYYLKGMGNARRD